MFLIYFFIFDIVSVSAHTVPRDYRNLTFEGDDCFFQENIYITRENSQCFFTVTDVNRNLDSLDFKIEKPENEIFEFQFKEKPSQTDYGALVVLVLQNSTLDYNNQSKYQLKVRLTDIFGLTASAAFTVSVFKPPKWIDPPEEIKINKTTIYNLTLSASKGEGHPDGTILYQLSDPTGLIEINQNQIMINTNDGKLCDWSKIELGIKAYYNTTPYADSKISIKVIFDNPPVIDFMGESNSSVLLIERDSKLFVRNFQISDWDSLCDYSNFFVNLKLPQRYAEAFELSPQNGSKLTNFSMTVHPEIFDSNEPFHIEIGASSSNDPTIATNYPIHVRLSSSSQNITYCNIFLFFVFFSNLINCIL